MVLVLGWSRGHSGRIFKPAYRCFGRCASSRETAAPRNASALARVLFQLVFVQGNGFHKESVLFGSGRIIYVETFANNAELVEQFHSRRRHSVDLDIHKNSFSQRRESKNRPVATNFQFLKIFCPSGTSLLKLLRVSEVLLLGRACRGNAPPSAVADRAAA